MKITIDCDENEIFLSNDNTENGFVDVSLLYPKGATVHPAELIKALKAFNDTEACSVKPQTQSSCSSPSCFDKFKLGLIPGLCEKHRTL